MASVRKSLNRMVNKGTLPEETAAGALANIRLSTGLEVRAREQGSKASPCHVDAGACHYYRTRYGTHGACPYAQGVAMQAAVQVAPSHARRNPLPAAGTKGGRLCD
jgi:hypothetical protein